MEGNITGGNERDDRRLPIPSGMSLEEDRNLQDYMFSDPIRETNIQAMVENIINELKIRFPLRQQQNSIDYDRWIRTHLVEWHESWREHQIYSARQLPAPGASTGTEIMRVLFEQRIILAFEYDAFLLRNSSFPLFPWRGNPAKQLFVYNKQLLLLSEWRSFATGREEGD